MARWRPRVRRADGGRLDRGSGTWWGRAGWWHGCVRRVRRPSLTHSRSFFLISLCATLVGCRAELLLPVSIVVPRYKCGGSERIEKTHGNL
jgi:hypothetical protein